MKRAFITLTALLIVAAAVQAQIEFVVDANTAALWHFNEAAGTTAHDATTNHYDLTLSDGAGWYLPGYLGAASADLTDPDAKLTRSGCTVGNGWDELTIDAYVKPAMLNANENPIVERYEYYATDPAYYLTILPDGRLYGGVYSTGGGESNLITTPAILNMNVVYYVRMTWRSGDLIKIYVDNNLVGSAPAAPGTIRNSTHPLTVGWFQDTHYGDFYFNGLIDEVRISDIVRDEEQVVWADDFEDGNYTSNPPWQHVSGATNVVIFDNDYSLEVYGTDGGNTNGVIQAQIPIHQQFKMEFDLYRRSPSSDAQNTFMGFSETSYAQNAGFALMVYDCNNIRTLWNETYLNQVGIPYYTYQWYHVKMERYATGAWTIIWDEYGSSPTTITGQDQFGTIDNLYFWVVGCPHYSNPNGAYFDDFAMSIPGTQPPVTVTLTPVNPPIVIPAAGGSFAYEIRLHNNTAIQQSFQFWCNAAVPGGSQFTTLGPFSLSIGANDIVRMRNQSVPGTAPEGSYTYWGFVGTHPWTVSSSSNFTFTKLGADGDWAGSDGWFCGGEPFPGEVVDEVPQPVEFALSGAYPNPFNPTTTLTFSLPTAAQAQLSIYDISGRLVAKLVDGYRDAGVHEVYWDASGLPSGLYSARLEAGGRSAAEKLLLLK